MITTLFIFFFLFLNINIFSQSQFINKSSTEIKKVLTDKKLAFIKDSYENIVTYNRWDFCSDRVKTTFAFNKDCCILILIDTQLSYEELCEVVSQIKGITLKKSSVDFNYPMSVYTLGIYRWVVYYKESDLSSSILITIAKNDVKGDF